MKKELRKLMKLFFELKTINFIDIKKEITKDQRFIKYKIEFFTLNK